MKVKLPINRCDKKGTNQAVTYFKYAIVLVAIILVGCTGHFHRKQSDEHIDNVKKEISTFPILENEPAVMYVSEPPVSSTPLEIVSLPGWADDSYTSSASNFPFYYIAEDVVKRAGVFVTYGPDVDQEKKMDFRVNESGTVYDAIKALASKSGYHFEIHENSVAWSANVYETFNLAYVGGKYNYLVGSEPGGDETSQSANAGTSIELGGNSEQFANVTAEGQDLYQEIEDALRNIVGESGDVRISKAAASASIKTTPSRMIHVRRYMDELKASLSRAVILEFKVIKFTSNIDSASGIDWNLFRETTKNSLTFESTYANSVTQTLFSGAPISFGAARETGKYSGSQLFLKALEEQGRVSIVTEPRVHTMVNRVAMLERSELTGYIARTEVTANNDAEPSVEIEPGTVKDGYSIYAIANIDDHSRVLLHVSSNLSDLIQITRKDVGNSAIETPQYTENRFSQTAILKSGHTMVLNGLSQHSNQTGGASPINARFLPTLRRGKSRLEETIVLVTPTIFSTGTP